ncbi:MAG: hypothetical protein EZS28_050287 [Streblomastix strix]|uniref:Uncharacterized protein n=1 Tax=Streblomastix strix TaxID=222440 RepID=A0A5J4T6W8_9EUKA|nr:MAG: hypothetical protein EZS28_050287 [Streblomastix strix]
MIRRDLDRWTFFTELGIDCSLVTRWIVIPIGEVETTLAGSFSRSKGQSPQRTAPTTCYQSGSMDFSSRHTGSSSSLQSGSKDVLSQHTDFIKLSFTLFAGSKDWVSRHTALG